MAKMPRIFIKILMPVMDALTPTCEVISHKISESLDHPLPLADRIRVRLHLLGCELCARYEKQLRAIHQMMEQSMSNMQDVTSENKLSDEARKRMKDILTHNHS